MPRSRGTGGKPPKRPIEQYEHRNKQRMNNPPAGLVTAETDPPLPTHKTYDYVMPVPSVPHINLAVFDSRWEASEAFELDRSDHVRSWVKNDHLGFEITYSYRGVIHKYRPDYLVRLTNGKMLVLEIKGQDDQQQQTKREFLAEWTRAVNDHGGFGDWVGDVSRYPSDIHEILVRNSQ